MPRTSRPRLKFLAFSLLPVFGLLAAAETAVRIKYFVAHGYEWPYLTAPFGAAAFAPANKEEVFKNPAAASNQVNMPWSKPCADTLVESSELHQKLPRTFDENCFRGDRVSRQKPADEYRIVFVGGSTVEDAQSDAEMMTRKFKDTIPPTRNGKRVTVVNAGRVTFESRRIANYYFQSIQQFHPDLVIYYEAWNEQPQDARWARVDDSLARYRSSVHRMLYYRSMLYTYLVEKFAFVSDAGQRFWKIDVEQLRAGFGAVVTRVRASGARLVFVTQAFRLPRMWKGVDTFDYDAVDALIDRLKADPAYAYDVSEIICLNQRLAVAYTLRLCREHGVPAVNILDAIEGLGDAGRAELFMDLGHLTVKGDRVIGELIAKNMTWP